MNQNQKMINTCLSNYFNASNTFTVQNERNNNVNSASNFYSKRKRKTEMNNSCQKFRFNRVMKVINEANRNTFLNQDSSLKLSQTMNKSKTRIKTQTWLNRNSRNIDQELIQKIKLKKTIGQHLRNNEGQMRRLFNSYEALVQSANRANFQKYQIEFLDNFLKAVVQFSKFQKQNKSEKNKYLNQRYTKTQEQNQVIRLENIKLFKQNELLKNKLSQNRNQPDRVSFSKFNFLNCQRPPNQEQGQIRQRTSNIITQTKSNFYRKSICNNQFATVLNKQAKIEQLQKTVRIIQQQLKDSNQMVFILKEDKKMLENKLAQQTQKKEDLCAQYLKLKELTQNSREKFLRQQSFLRMQQEQIISYQVELLTIRRQYFELNRKYVILLKRMKQSQENSKQKQKPVEIYQKISANALEYFSQQVQSFLTIRRFLKSQPTLLKPIAKNEIERTILYKKFMKGKQSMDNSQAIKKYSKEYLQFLKPTFFCFVQDSLILRGISEQNYEYCTNMKQRQTTLMVRGIFDSKFNQFLDFKNFRQHNLFSIFAYSWIANFQIDKARHCIKTRNGDFNSDTAADFYISLMQKNLNSNWQIVAFRQFLMGSLGNDQLYFYLMMRFYLLRGSMLQKPNAFFSSTFNILYSQVQSFLANLAIENDFLRRIKSSLKKQIKSVKNKQYIDINFTLRFLLEFYIKQKQKNVSKIYAIFDSMGLERSAKISFQKYMLFYDQIFQFLSYTQKLEIYRSAFTVSNGSITPQIIVSVLVEQNYFCHFVPQIYRNQQIQKQAKVHEILLIQEKQLIKPPLPYIIQQQQFYRKFSNQYIDFSGSFLGLEQIKYQYQKISILSSQTIFSRYQFAQKICFLIAKRNYYSRKISNQGLEKFIIAQKNCLSKSIKETLQKVQIWNIIQTAKRDAAASKIFRIYCRKKTQRTRKIFPSLQAEQQNQKKQNMRKQFCQLVESIKGKHEHVKNELE